MTHHATAPSAGAKEWWGLVVLGMPTFLVSIDVSILHLALPHIAKDLNPTNAQTLWIVDSYGFMLAAFLITMGVIGDRIGRRRLLLVGGVLFALTSVAASLAPNSEILILARALMGVSAATLMPSTLSLIMNMFKNDRERGQAIGIWVAMFSGGIALGPLVGGALLTQFSWRSVFLLALPVVAVLLLAGPRLLPEYKNPSSGRMDILSVVLFVVGILSFVHGVKQIGDGVDVGLGLAFVIAVAAGTGFAVRQQRLEQPWFDMALLRNRTIVGCLTVMMVAMVVAGGTYLFATQYLQLVAGMNPFIAGLWLLPSAVLLTITAGAAPALAQKYRPGVVVAGGMLMSLIGHVILVTASADSTTAVLVGFTLAYGGGGPMVALGTDLVMGSAPPERAGAASAMSETSTELGMAMGVAVLGTLGTSVYRQGLPPDMPAQVSAAAERGLANLLSLGADPQTLQVARSAFADGLSAVALASAIVSMGLIAVSLFVIDAEPLGLSAVDDAAANAAREHELVPLPDTEHHQ